MTSSSSYTKVAIWLHWVIAVLIISQIIGGKVMLAMGPSSLKWEIFQLHKSFGFVILALSLIRLLWRLTHKAPPLPEGMKPFEKLGAKLSHWGFYILMIGTPMAGWVLVSSSVPQIATKIFKVIPVPDVPGVTRSEALNARMSEVHEYMAYAIVGLLVLHVAAALKHHFIDKDDVLTRMVPRLKMKAK